MGYIRHDAIVVTGDLDNKLLFDAHRKARDLGCSVTSIAQGTANATGSFLVAPDGGKEGWPESEAGNVQRDNFVAWLREQCWGLDWAELVVSDENGPARVTRSSGEPAAEPTVIDADPGPAAIAR